MLIVIDEYGVKLDVDNGWFRFRSENHNRRIHPRKVSAIHICKPTSITSVVIEVAIAQSIPIIFKDKYGSPVGRLWTAKFGSTVRIRHAQLAQSKMPLGLNMAGHWLSLKMQGMIQNLKHLADRRPSSKAKVAKALERIEVWKKALNLAQTKEKLTNLDALASKRYWATISAGLKDYESFVKRSRRPAKDRFNALLNYGYGMLYSWVETAVVTAGLDPHIGFLHREEYNRPALVFDMVEAFRPWVDRALIDLCLSKQLEDAHTKQVEGGVWLAKTGKALWIPLLMTIMEQRTLFNGRRIKRIDQVQHLATQSAQRLLKAKAT